MLTSRYFYVHINVLFTLHFVQVFNRLQKLNVCMSHQTTVKLVEMLGSDFDTRVHYWRDSLINDLDNVTVVRKHITTCNWAHHVFLCRLMSYHCYIVHIVKRRLQIHLQIVQKKVYLKFLVTHFVHLKLHLYHQSCQSVVVHRMNQIMNSQHSQ